MWQFKMWQYKMETEHRNHEFKIQLTFDEIVYFTYLTDRYFRPFQSSITVKA